jgi:hypothetical protein
MRLLGIDDACQGYVNVQKTRLPTCAGNGGDHFAEGNDATIPDIGGTVNPVGIARCACTSRKERDRGESESQLSH